MEPLEWLTPTPLLPILNLVTDGPHSDHRIQGPSEQCPKVDTCTVPFGYFHFGVFLRIYGVLTGGYTRINHYDQSRRVPQI